MTRTRCVPGARQCPLPRQSRQPIAPEKTFQAMGRLFCGIFFFLGSSDGWIGIWGGGRALRMGRRDDAWNPQVKQWALRARKAPFPELSGRDDVFIFFREGCEGRLRGWWLRRAACRAKNHGFLRERRPARTTRLHDASGEPSDGQKATQEALDCPARDCLARQTATRPAGWMVMAAPRNGWWPRRSEVTPRQRTGDVASGISRKSDKWLCHKTVRHPLPRQVFSHAGNVFLRLGTRSESGVHNQS